MAYDRIISWVESNFDTRQFDSYVEFEQAVRQRFNNDGIDLPKGAESQMIDYFQRLFPEPESPLVVPASMLDTYIPPSPEILEISPDFFNTGAPLVESVQPLPDIFQDVTPLQSSQPTSFFGKVSGFFKRLFRI